MSDKKNQFDIIGQVPDSVTHDELDMSRDLPMQSAIDVVARSRLAAEKKNNILADDAKIFAKTLRQFLIDHGLVVDNDDRATYRLFSGVVYDFTRKIFAKLRGEIPSYQILRNEIDKLLNGISVKVNRFCNYSSDELAELANNMMMVVWPDPIQPYIKNMLLRETAIKSIDLLALWHSAVETGELTREEAASQLAYCGEKANNVSKMFTNDSSIYFCKDVEEMNNIAELQDMWNKEKGNSLDSWEKKHGAFVKASLMYAIHMIDGTIDRTETGMVMKEIKRRVMAVCKDIDGSRILVNPTDDGELGPNSLIVGDIDFNSKEAVSEYLKFITKLLSDNISPDVHTTSDRHRFRAYLLEDPRESHPSFANLNVEVAEIAAATKWMAIIMMLFGTTVDKRNVRNSIDTGQGINGNSGRVHRAIQWKGSITVDKKANGSIREKGKAYMYESQALCFVKEGDYEADIAEYTRKKVLRAQKTLGVGVGFVDDTLNLCTVFANRYSFLNDKPEMRELAEISFGHKMLKVPFMKETVASKLLGRLVSSDITTRKVLKEMFQQKSFSKTLKQVFREMETYLYGLKRHYLVMRSMQLIQIGNGIISDKSLMTKIAEFNRLLVTGRFVEMSTLGKRVEELKILFNEYALLSDLPNYDNENYLYLKGIIEEINAILEKGPSGLDVELREAKKIYRINEPDGESESNPDQLSFFED